MCAAEAAAAPHVYALPATLDAARLQWRRVRAHTACAQRPGDEGAAPTAACFFFAARRYELRKAIQLSADGYDQYTWSEVVWVPPAALLARSALSDTTPGVDAAQTTCVEAAAQAAASAEGSACPSVVVSAAGSSAQPPTRQSSADAAMQPSAEVAPLAGVATSSAADACTPIAQALCDATTPVRCLVRWLFLFWLHVHVCGPTRERTTRNAWVHVCACNLPAARCAARSVVQIPLLPVCEAADAFHSLREALPSAAAGERSAHIDAVRSSACAAVPDACVTLPLTATFQTWKPPSCAAMPAPPACAADDAIPASSAVCRVIDAVSVARAQPSASPAPARGAWRTYPLHTNLDWGELMWCAEGVWIRGQFFALHAMRQIHNRIAL